MKLLDSAVSRFRTTACILLLILMAGLVARANMTIEASPNPSVPIAVISVFQDGVSPEDGARLLVRPIEQELRSLEGIKEIKATARESIAYIIVEFEAEQDIDQALVDTRVAVDRAKAKLPTDAEEPVVEEVSADDSPTVILTISGAVSERVLYQTAQRLRREIESVPSVLEANLTGHREEVAEIIISPEQLEHYQITSGDLLNAVYNNNLLVPAGQLDDGRGRFAVKVPSLIETREDLFSLPLKSTADGTVTLGDVAQVRRTFKDPWQVTRVNGQRAIAIEVRKRRGANDTEVADAVHAIRAAAEPTIPDGILLDTLMDQSEFAAGMVGEMQGNIITAMALVMVIVVAALGLSSGMLVGFGVPFSLLFAATVLYFIGFSFNFMVLFGMLLALGMLIDGAIVITEFADRKMAEGMTNRAAYALAVKRMFWPVMASTGTTLAAFLPIMFWPGVAGEFMRYLPVTVFAVLVGSLFYALLFAPAIGSVLGKRKALDSKTTDYLQQIEFKPPQTLPGITGRYARLLQSLVKHPGRMMLVSVAILVASYSLYGRFGVGSEFFVKTENKYGQAMVRMQGNYSVAESEKVVAEVEERFLKVEGLKVLYSVTSPSAPQQFGARPPEKDQVGSMLVELEDPAVLPRSTFDIYAEMRDITRDMPGIFVSANALEDGPPVGKPIQLQLTSSNSDKLLEQTRWLREQLEQNIPGLRDVTDSSPLAGVEWSIDVDRPRAAQLGADVLEVGRAVQLVTNGVKVGEYRPNDADEEIDIRVRYPSEYRGLGALDRLKINTQMGPVPISSFVERRAVPKVDKVQRVDGREYMMVMADVKEGENADNLLKDIQAWLADNPVDPEVTLEFRGANEEQAKSMNFLATAFSLALFLMFILLVSQFNSFYQAFLTLSSVIMSTAGVLLGLTLTQSTFSTIMTGVGIVALAGIVVNNNIVLIDTFNHLRQSHAKMTALEAAIAAGAQRLRPVFLTTATTILGLLPLAAGLSVDFIEREFIYGGMVGSYWKALASAIVYGLLFSTILTLLLTPAMLVLPSVIKTYLEPLKLRKNWAFKATKITGKRLAVQGFSLTVLLVLAVMTLFSAPLLGGLLLALMVTCAVGSYRGAYWAWVVQLLVLILVIVLAVLTAVSTWAQFDFSLVNFVTIAVAGALAILGHWLLRLEHRDDIRQAYSADD